MKQKYDIMHIASLAKLNINENELEKYNGQITDILTEIDKILKVEIKEKEILINPNRNTNIFKNDEIGKQLNKDEIFINAPNHDNDYIIVPKVIE